MNNFINKKLTLGVYVAIVLAIIIAPLAFADGFQVDGDVFAPGNQNVINLTASPGGSVAFNGQIVITRSGSNHLDPGTEVTFQVDTGPTNLPAGYSVGNAVVTIPSVWDTNGQTAAGTSAISFTAPGEGDYTYTVKWESTVDYGNKLTGGSALTINLTVSAPACTYRFEGFHQPVEMGSGVVNTVKGGSTVPLKFNLFENCGGVETEVTSTAGISLLVNLKATCDAGALEDPLSETATGKTELRYDFESGQFVYNWKTQTGKDKCYSTSVGYEGTSISANFKTK